MVKMTKPEGGDRRQRRRSGDLAPDPELWRALGGGVLQRILEDFYARVYDDPRLGPFFEGVTRERAVEKQYNFLMELFTGERVYFGARPRNAHHWMVISHELFDYREDLLAEVCRAHGLGEEHIARWRRADEIFRKQIVKDVPVPLKLGGQALPLEGYESLVLSAGALCDGCHAEIQAGDEVRYHVRLGTTFCSRCSSRLPGGTGEEAP